MIRNPTTRAIDHFVGAATIAGCIVALEVAVRSGTVNAILVPPPTAIAEKTVDLILSGSALEPLASTLSLLAIAYFSASAVAILFGLAMGRYPALYNLFEPVVEVVRPLPKPALLPPLILLLGLGNAMKLTIVGLAVFFPVLINTIQGVRGVDPVLINTARTFGKGSHAIISKIVLPAAIPLILVGMRISLAFGLILVVMTEMVSGTGGLGFVIIDMQRSFKVQEMYAWVVILAALGYALNLVFVKTERYLTRWAPVDATR
jgi:ABC-type nitrate/sulfonate/bicarbonate transport system permease component